jgi:serine/threonine protein kinase
MICSASVVLQGSFGTVYKGAWHGKAVAVKIMHFPAGALLNVEDASSVMGLSNADPLQRQHVPYGRVPEMGLMEAVVSSAMCHPNVVQVYTYMMDPLSTAHSNIQGSGTAGSTDQSAGGAPSGGGAGEVSINSRAASGGANKHITGWELKIIMEYCNGVSVGALKSELKVHGSIKLRHVDACFLRTLKHYLLWPSAPRPKERARAARTGV